MCSLIDDNSGRTETYSGSYTPFSILKSIFAAIPIDDNRRRFTFCLAIRDEILEGYRLSQSPPSRTYFESLHNLMLQESNTYRDLMNHVASQSRSRYLLNGAIDMPQTEYDGWRQFHRCAIGQNEILYQCSDEQWVKSVLNETKSWLQDNPPKRPNETWRHFTAAEIILFLECGSRPNLDKAEAYFCSTVHAASLIDSGAVLIINHQQAFEWIDGPIKDLFTTYIPKDKLNAKHPVSIPSLPMDSVDRRGNLVRDVCFKDKTLKQIRNKFPTDNQHQQPLHLRWNVMDMEQWVPVPYPPFLEGSNSQVLQALRGCNGTVLSGRTIKFMLVSQGGNHTSSHVDDHGYGVFLTVQEGVVGIGWIAVTSWQDRIKWGGDPASVKEKARYIVLRPNQTVYLPPGTIHFVFRQANQPTLITGGEIVTWPGIRRWLCILKHQELSEQEEHVTAESSLELANHLLQVLKQQTRAESWAILGGRQEAETIYATLEKWGDFETIEDYFAFQGWDMETF